MAIGKRGDAAVIAMGTCHAFTTHNKETGGYDRCGLLRDAEVHQ